MEVVQFGDHRSSSISFAAIARSIPSASAFRSSASLANVSRLTLSVARSAIKPTLHPQGHRGATSCIRTSYQANPDASCLGGDYVDLARPITADHRGHRLRRRWRGGNLFVHVRSYARHCVRAADNELIDANSQPVRLAGEFISDVGISGHRGIIPLNRRRGNAKPGA
jgi:hypothetical protein